MSYGKATEDFHLWTLDADKTREMVKYPFDNGVTGPIMNIINLAIIPFIKRDLRRSLQN